MFCLKRAKSDVSLILVCYTFLLTKQKLNLLFSKRQINLSPQTGRQCGNEDIGFLGVVTTI